MGRVRASPRRVSWEREGGRLVRLRAAAHFVDTDIMVYDIEAVDARAVAAHTAEQRVPPLPTTLATTLASSSGERISFSTLHRHNCLDTILGFLGARDIEALGKVSAFLASMVDSAYLRLVCLPLAPATARALGGRAALALTSCCNLAWLPSIATFHPFNQLNLSQLRELKLIGKNLDVNFHPGLEGRLSGTYHRSLAHLLALLATSATLRRLEILTDGTDASIEAARRIQELVNLEELTLHGIGHFSDCASYYNNIQTINTIIQLALANPRIETLNLKKMEVKASEEFIIKSEHLRKLTIMQCKVIKLRQGSLDLPRLVALETDQNAHFYGSIKHTDEELVASACPLLKTWNGNDLNYARPYEGPTLADY